MWELSSHTLIRTLIWGGLSLVFILGAVWFANFVVSQDPKQKGLKFPVSAYAVPGVLIFFWVFVMLAFTAQKPKPTVKDNWTVPQAQEIRSKYNVLKEEHARIKQQLEDQEAASTKKRRRSARKRKT